MDGYPSTPPSSASRATPSRARRAAAASYAKPSTLGVSEYLLWRDRSVRSYSQFLMEDDGAQSHGFGGVQLVPGTEAFNPSLANAIFSTW
jgi:hypothetical protein